MRYVRLVVASLLAFATARPGSGQAARLPAGPIAGPIAVFIDCRAHCDGEFLRTEITYVNWVRDREVADVHLLITSQGAGAGGEQVTFAFIGLRALAGRGDTLTFTTNPTTTSDERRKGITQTIAVGLVQFAARTTAGQTLRVSAAAATAGSATRQMAPKNDPWDAWVFSIRLNGSTNGEHYYKSQNLNSHLSARRVTDAWKTEFDFSHSYRDNHVTVQSFDSTGLVVSDTTYKNLQRDWNGGLLQVKSLTDHWSLAANLEMASQTYRNQKLRFETGAAVEFDFFPYSEATRHELMVRYGVGLTSYRYADTTVFDKIRETLPNHLFEIEFRTRQPWGSGNVRFEHRNFLTDASKRNTQMSAGFDIRLFRGFGINAGGGYEWIHDQVYLPRGEQTSVDVLLRRRALLTGFQYQAFVGFSYTFGSIYNNVVNPRF